MIDYKKSKILLVFIGIMFSFLMLEISLRMAGYFFKQREYRRHKSVKSTFDKTINILCLGDSFTFGLGASYDFSYPRQLEKILNENNPNKKIFVHNYGIPGQNSSEILRDLSKYIKAIMPDVVILMVGINNYPHFRHSNYWFFANMKDIGFKTYFCKRADYFLLNFRSYEMIKYLILNFKNETIKNESKNQENHNNCIEDPFLDLNPSKENEVERLCLDMAGEYIARRQYDLAKKSVYKAFESNPKSLRGHLLLAMSYREEKKYSQAKIEIRKAININDKYHNIFTELGIIYFYEGRNNPGIREGNFKLAVKNFKKAISLNSRDANAYRFLASVYKDEGKNDLAAQVARELLNIYPGNQELEELCCEFLPSLRIDHPEIFDQVLEYDLKNIINLAENNHIKIVIMSYPDSSYQDNIRKKIAEKYKTYYIDNFTKFKKLLKDKYVYSDLFSDDGTHCNASGYKIVAEEIHKRLKSDANLGIN